MMLVNARRPSAFRKNIKLMFARETCLWIQLKMLAAQITISATSLMVALFKVNGHLGSSAKNCWKKKTKLSAIVTTIVSSLTTAGILTATTPTIIKRNAWGCIHSLSSLSLAIDAKKTRNSSTNLKKTWAMEDIAGLALPSSRATRWCAWESAKSSQTLITMIDLKESQQSANWYWIKMMRASITTRTRIIMIRS